jgi:energy-coupling factor transporter ATP-binding protein EcfA2
MIRTMLYIFGQPGSGKSTLVQALVGETLAMPTRVGGLDLIDYLGSGVMEIGKDRDRFRGTDALAMNVINTASAVLPQLYESTDLLAEGDRLAVDRFFREVRDTGYGLELIYLDTPNEEAAARRAQRAGQGKKQDQTWVQGRITKAQRLAERWNPARIDGSLPLEEQIVQLKDASEIATRFAEISAGV